MFLLILKKKKKNNYSYASFLLCIIWFSIVWISSINRLELISLMDIWVVAVSYN